MGLKFRRPRARKARGLCFGGSVGEVEFQDAALAVLDDSYDPALADGAAMGAGLMKATLVDRCAIGKPDLADPEAPLVIPAHRARLEV